MKPIHSVLFCLFLLKADVMLGIDWFLVFSRLAEIVVDMDIPLGIAS